MLTKSKEGATFFSFVSFREENRYLRREKLFFFRYLQRTQTAKVAETFDDYRDIDESTLAEILGHLDPTKSAENLRRPASKSPAPALIRKGSGQNSPSSSYRVRISSSRGSRDRTGASPFRLVIQRRLALAHYELEQTRLEWGKMTANAQSDIDNLKVCLLCCFSFARLQLKFVSFSFFFE